MTMTQPDRDKLFTKLRKVLGSEDAGTLIEMLPPDRQDLATKSDIAGLSQEIDGLSQRFDGLDQKMSGLDQRMEKFENRLWDLHGALRAQTRVYAMIVVTAMIGMGSLSFAAGALL